MTRIWISKINKTTKPKPPNAKTHKHIMDRVFSVEEISDHFWPSSSSSSATTNSASADDDNKSSSKMNRSASEWAFQQFIREEVEKEGEDEGVTEGDLNKKNGTASFNNGCLESNGNNNVLVDSEYQAFLKNKLNLACAAVAMSRVSLFLSLFI